MRQLTGPHERTEWARLSDCLIAPNTIRVAGLPLGIPARKVLCPGKDLSGSFFNPACGKYLEPTRRANFGIRLRGHQLQMAAYISFHMFLLILALVSDKLAFAKGLTIDAAGKGFKS